MKPSDRIAELYTENARRIRKNPDYRFMTRDEVRRKENDAIIKAILDYLDEAVSQPVEPHS